MKSCYHLFDSIKEHLYNLITQKIYYKKNDGGDIVIQFTPDTNEKAIVPRRPSRSIMTPSRTRIHCQRI